MRWLTRHLSPWMGLWLLMWPAHLWAQADLLDGFGGALGFGEGELAPGDDDSTPPIDLSGAFPEGLNFFGSVYSEVFVNHNGNISFNQALPFFIPEPFPVSNQPMIAPFWADVDTRLQEAGIANQVHYHVDDAGGRFIATWYEVGYFSLHTDLANSFQVILSDRSDVAPGDFDVEFRYNRCEWHTGDPPLSGAEPRAAQAGFDAGNLSDFFVLPGSLTPQVLALCDTSNRDDPGVWVFEIRVGDVRICGNEIVELDEACDDGGESATCDPDCTFAECGDGYRNETAGEACDDGNTDDGDGCSGSCAVEEGWSCTRDRAGLDHCEPICGDGLIRGDEACDDGNTDDGDGCSSQCTVEPGWTCTGEPSVCVREAADPMPDLGPDAGGEGLELAGGGVGCRAGTGGLAEPLTGLLMLALLARLGRRRRHRI